MISILLGIEYYPNLKIHVLLKKKLNWKMNEREKSFLATTPSYEIPNYFLELIIKIKDFLRNYR